MSGDLERSDRPVGGEPLAPRRGIDRRTLVKRAAVAGAVAWTAPVILDSLASPAAAGSCGLIYRFEFDMDATCQGGDGALTRGVGTYASDGCYGFSNNAIPPPSAYTETVTDIPSGQSSSTQCVTLTSISTGSVVCSGCQAPFSNSGCDSRSNNVVEATLSQATCTPTASGLSSCNGTKTFLAAGYTWRTADCGNFCRTWQAGGLVVKTNGSGSAADCNGRDGQPFADKTMIPVSGTTIQFQQPASDKGPDHSGSYQFVIGCGCT